MLIQPSSGACDLFVELFHGLYCSGTTRVGVTLWFGWGGVVWYPDAGWSPPWSTSKGMTSCMGHVVWQPSLVRGTTVLTWPSRPYRNSLMQARPHKCLGRTSSWIRTTSPRRSWAIFPTGCWTSWKFLSSNRYSFVQRFQKSSDSFCFNRSSLAKLCLAVGIVLSPSPIRKCAGVRAAESSPCVMGLELTAASMLIKVVFNCSSVSLDCPSTFPRQRFTVPTILPTKPLAER